MPSLALPSLALPSLALPSLASPGKPPARRVARAACCLAVLTLAACSEQVAVLQDPLYDQGRFQPLHTNRSNLVLQVANPSDLVRGQSGAAADGQLAAVAVDRLRNDKVKRLPANDVATITAGNSGDNNSAGGTQ